MQNLLQFILIFLVVGLTIGALIGAIILRASCALYNKLAGGPRTYPGDWDDGHDSLGAPSQDHLVPEPEFGHAFGILCVSTLVNFVAGMVVVFLVTMYMTRAGPEQIQFTAQLISLPVGLFVMAGTICVMLPTSFGRGLLLSLCYMLIVICIVVIVIFGVMALA